MDTIFNSAFGIDLDAQKNPENSFLVEGIRFFRERAEFQTSILLRCNLKASFKKCNKPTNMLNNINVYFALKVIFPEMKPILKGLSKLWAGLALPFSDKYVLPAYSLLSKIHKILDNRIQNKTEKQDYLQILLNAYDESVTNEVDKDAILDVSTMKVEKKISGDVSEKKIKIFIIDNEYKKENFFFNRN
jgi:hypothetical protein